MPLCTNGNDDLQDVQMRPLTLPVPTHCSRTNIEGRVTVKSCM